jgi:hypothetical protein
MLVVLLECKKEDIILLGLMIHQRVDFLEIVFIFHLYVDVFSTGLLNNDKLILLIFAYLVSHFLVIFGFSVF